MSTTTATEAPAAPRTEDTIVTFWDIAKKQYSKNLPAMIALWCVIALIILATAAPLISLNLPFMMKSNIEGAPTTFPLFDHMFNRLVFASGVDIFFNLLLFIGPVWWLFGAALRAAGAAGGDFDKRKLLATAIPFGIVFLFLVLLAFVTHDNPDDPEAIYARDFYRWLLVGAVAGLAVTAAAHLRMRGRPERVVRKQRVWLRFWLFVFFMIGFTLTMTPEWAQDLGAPKLDFTAQAKVTMEVEDPDTGELVRRDLEYRTALQVLEKSDRGFAVNPPFFNHPDNKFDDNEVVVARILRTPSLSAEERKERGVSWSAYPLGTDNTGKDVFSRILYGTRISLTIGIIAVSIYATIGTILGSIAGYFGGKIDLFILFVLQVMICIPGIFLILTIVSVFESRSIFMIMLAIGLVGWTGITRLVRGEFLRQRSIDYVTAARALGIPQRRIIFGHILKNSLSPVLVAAAFGIAAAILTESFLSFIGLGDTNAPSWGQLLQEGRNLRKNWLIFSPGLAIFFVVTVLNMVGDGLRDALDPKLRQ
jgi:peptide/nickel transport system permease protein